MADNCVICQIIEGKVPSKKLYEDDEVYVFLDVNGATPGHTFVVPKKHYPIFEQVPDALVGKLFNISNKVSTSLFEALEAQGTNLFISNGVSAGQSVAHFVINVIPRRENDNIDLQWKPRQLSEEEMSTVELRIKDGAKNMGIIKDEKKAESKPEKREFIEQDEDNYLWRSVNKKVS